MRRMIIAVASLLALSAPALANASGGHRAPEHRTEKRVDPAEQAQKHFSGWQEQKRSCYEKAGLSAERGEYRVSPQNKLTFQIRNDVWLQPDKYNLKALMKCKTM